LLLKVTGYNSFVERSKMMMRRLLVLMLVLGMTSVASAATVAVYTNVTQGADALTALNADGDAIKIVIGLDAASAGGNTGFSVDIENSTGATGTVLQPASWMMVASAKAAVPFGATGQTQGFNDGVIGMPAPVGDWLQVDFTIPAGTVAGDPGGNIDIGYNGTLCGAAPAGAGLPLVPEPITIALLGLGGLFLRRRK
jgi:hypothetical protein